MGKIVTIYLSDKEARDLRAFCDENQCTQYSALKVAVNQILSKPVQREEVEIPEEFLVEPLDETVHDEDIQNEVLARAPNSRCKQRGDIQGASSSI
jgi:hypothetical protein